MAILLALASPADNSIESRRSRYPCGSYGALAQPPSEPAASEIKSRARMLLDNCDIATSRQVKHVTGKGTWRGTRSRCLHRQIGLRRTRHLIARHQEEVGIAWRCRFVGRRLQHFTRTGRPHEARRHDDDEVGLVLLI